MFCVAPPVSELDALVSVQARSLNKASPEREPDVGAVMLTVALLWMFTEAQLFDASLVVRMIVVPEVAFKVAPPETVSWSRSMTKVPAPRVSVELASNVKPRHKT